MRPAWRHAALLAVVLAVATVVLVWPLPLHAGRALVGQIYQPDSYILMAALDWGRHTLWHDPSHVFDAPFCYPGAGSLAGSEHMLGFAPLWAPLRALAGDPITAYQLLFVLVQWGAALAMAALVARWTGDLVAAGAAGLLYAFAPFRVAQAAWLHALATFCLPLMLLAFDALVRDRPGRPALALAVLLAWQVTLPVYGAVFAAVGGVLFALGWLVVGGRPWPWSRLALAALATLAALPPLWFLVRGYGAGGWLLAGHPTLGGIIGRQAAGVFPLDPLADVGELATRLARLLGLRRMAPWAAGAPVAVDAGRPALVLAAVGLWVAFRRGDRRQRARAAGLALLVVAGVLLAMGPGFVPVPGGAVPLPLVWLDELPVVSALRTPERWISLAALGLATAAGLGLAALLRGRTPAVRVAVATVVVLLARLDAGALVVTPVAPFGPPDAAARALAADPTAAPVLEWPVLASWDTLARRMLNVTRHWHPTTLCLTGLPPPTWWWFVEPLVQGATPDVVATTLDRGGIRWVLARDGVPPPLDAAWRPVVDGRLFDRGRGEDLRARFADLQTSLDGTPRAPLPAAARTGDLALATPDAIPPAAPTRVVGTVRNASTVSWPADGPPGPGLVRLRLGWRDAAGAPLSTLRDPARRALLDRLPQHWQSTLRAAYTLADRDVGLGADLAPGATREVVALMPAPAVPGTYRLVASLVQTGTDAPFALAGGETDRRASVRVAERP